ncbi:2-succinyl-5-enolpyruvyl-6-hydroxy-3-cyclohexene-1-carboxylic-acid synthase [Lactobacillus sp. UCMA15818]|uniref:2-succinyl-5-enolpyruvyl-6-hydroxy-3- cyclohexene-1-carboxylic-acid synthase n=1 Tax=Lactobacillus sp. UCMA15818 TaxID=2583394 RepID=UPI0025B1393C|nr:2-succinyl-5-enolpyruvyl-6-hydroxy-3-cyclohexene-1-carboxylic-acid synthase [Lactobacillus sp. UCMA15818]MDN2453323.1 2-succinyl-5-enolpyruvyl-6-hydroxy-3-cyclohexene-1-carboxylic-acid synthase [Lactobacillus sp. UCMA15818]
MIQNETLTRHISLILNGLLLQGLTTAVIAPGSRSTPFALALAQLAQQKKIELFVDVDERSAAFFALGIAKKTHKPVLLICTSGTAAANFYPAVCEAAISQIPLLILTTDRPPELTKVAAPQALDQDHFFGNQVKAFFELPLPETNQDSQTYTNYVVQKSFQIAQSKPAGPVHLNQPLRKPLMPDLPIKFEQDQQKYVTLSSTSTLSSNLITELHTTLLNKRGIILAGPQQSTTSNTALLKWAEKSGWPILADPLSQLRGIPSSNIITCYDSLLKTKSDKLAALSPEVIIRTGQTFVAASLASFLKKSQATIYSLDEENKLNDYTKTSTFSLEISAEDFFEQFPPVNIPGNWLHTWSTLEKIYTSVNQINSLNMLNELDVIRVISATGSNERNLFVSNSMPIRDVDSVLQPLKSFRIFCNRGANGIDGIVSTALGVSAKSTENLLLIGDLAFFHDMNGLMMAKKYHLKIKIIVINNDGGGIFSFLPQADSSNFEEVFGTPLDIEIEQVAKLYHAHYSLVATVPSLTKCLSRPAQTLEIIEVRTDRNDNVNLHRELINRFANQIAKEF